jgi:hypothetical protein
MELTPEERRVWAEEHLLYEVATLKYATEQLGEDPEDMGEYVLLESFLVHARCLNDFLWRDRHPKHPRDALAADFCEPGEWKKIRDNLPQATLAEIRNRRRFGHEVMHLSYDRLSGYGEHKRWPCGKVFVELALALRVFALLALPDALDEKTRSRLKGLLPDLPIGTDAGLLAGATGADARMAPLVSRYEDITGGGGTR